MKEILKRELIQIINTNECILCNSELEARSYSDIVYEDRMLYYGYKCYKCNKEFNIYSAIDNIYLEENDHYVQVKYKEGPARNNIKKFELKVERKATIYALIETFNDMKYKITLISPKCWY